MLPKSWSMLRKGKTRPQSRLIVKIMVLRTNIYTYKMWGKSIWRPHSIWDMHALQLLHRAALRFPLGNKKHCFYLILFRNLFILSSILPWFDFDEHVHVAPNFLLISHPCTIVLLYYFICTILLYYCTLPPAACRFYRDPITCDWQPQSLAIM